MERIQKFDYPFFEKFAKAGIGAIGVLGPVLLLLSTVYLLSDKRTFITIYLVGFLFNIILNFFLKGLIQQPRPTEDKRIFNLEILKGDIIKYDRYGMPSGHVQSVFYSTAFIYLVLKNKTIAALYLLISFITIYQRLDSESHSILQVIIGSLIGSLMGYSVYYYGKKMLKGLLNFKKDDDAPI